MNESDTALGRLAARRRGIERLLTAAMIVLYFGFILLIAYRPDLLARLVVPGLSLGILLGGLVIVLSWILTWVYIRWMNKHYDAGLRDVRRGER